jgi:hypothetical protein
MLSVSTNVWLLTVAFVAMGLREIGEPPRKAMIVDLARADAAASTLERITSCAGLRSFLPHWSAAGNHLLAYASSSSLTSCARLLRIFRIFL